MLRFEDCLEFCALSEEEIKALAKHQHIPEILALERAGPPGPAS